jgi:hypothetical protein
MANQHGILAGNNEKSKLLGRIRGTWKFILK